MVSGDTQWTELITAPVWLIIVCGCACACVQWECARMCVCVCVCVQSMSWGGISCISVDWELNLSHSLPIPHGILMVNPYSPSVWHLPIIVCTPHINTARLQFQWSWFWHKAKEGLWEDQSKTYSGLLQLSEVREFDTHLCDVLLCYTTFLIRWSDDQRWMVIRYLIFSP